MHLEHVFCYCSNATHAKIKKLRYMIVVCNYLRFFIVQNRLT